MISNYHVRLIYYKEREVGKLKNNNDSFKFLSMLFLSTFLIMLVILLLLKPLLTSAAEKETGGANNTVVINSERYIISKEVKIIDNRTIIAKDDYEVLGFLTNYYTGGEVVDSVISLTVCKNGRLMMPYASYLSDFVGYEARYDSKGGLISSVSYGKDGIFNPVYYANYVGTESITCSISGMKIFKDEASAKAYAESGSLDGMINEDDVDSGSYDPDIGYLHDLKHKALMYGEQDENGFYENYDDRFTWSDYYPEYDESYLVEVRASCEVEVKKWFGVGKSTIYNSDIRELATGVPYKDFEYIVSLNEQKSLFNDFINEYMPGNSSMSDVISAGTYQFDAYYFRIYRWDEESGTYKYGLWVRLTKDGSALDATLNTTVDAGELDEKGNWKQKSDSDYGEGKKDTTIVGAGSDQDAAKDETDRKQEDKDNGGKPIDLSNTNFQELWEWFCGQLENLWNGLGVIPEFFGRLFSFLPSPVHIFIGLGIVVAIILRVLGR